MGIIYTQLCKYRIAVLGLSNNFNYSRLINTGLLKPIIEIPLPIGN